MTSTNLVLDTKLVLRSRARLSSVISAPAPPPPAATAERILALSRSHSLKHHFISQLEHETSAISHILLMGTSQVVPKSSRS